MSEADFELVTDPWGAYLRERQAHQATLELLELYEARGAILNGNGAVMQGRCRLCAETRGGDGMKYRNTCPCQTAASHVACERIRLSKEPRRGKRVGEGLFSNPSGAAAASDAKSE